MKKSKSIFIVLDPMDGPHVFKSLLEATRTMRKWAREAKDVYHDSYWDMSSILEYKFLRERKK
jgi:hypothetical protein